MRTWAYVTCRYFLPVKWSSGTMSFEPRFTQNAQAKQFANINFLKPGLSSVLPTHGATWPSKKKTLSPSLSLCQTFYLIHSVDQHSISTLAWFNHWCQSDLAKAVKVCTNDANCNLQPGWSTSCQSHFQACVIFFANANHDQLDGALSLLAFHLWGEAHDSCMREHWESMNQGTNIL